MLVASDPNQLVKDLMTPKEKMLLIENITLDNLPNIEGVVRKLKEKRVEKTVLFGN